MKKAMRVEEETSFTLKTLYDACPTFAAGQVTESGGAGGSNTWKFRPLNPNQLKGEPLQHEHITESLQAKPPATVSFNTAGSLFKPVGELCSAAIDGLRYPVNVNLYVTPQVTEEEANVCGKIVPLHNDRQDVLVFQTKGKKRWRVYPKPAVKKGVDPCSRGKAGDVLERGEVREEECLDVVLEEGDVLYVPMGWAHETATPYAEGGEEGKDKDGFQRVSIHLTLGVDTVVWGLTFAHLRWGILSYCGLDYKLDMARVGDEVYWKTMEALPFGFLGRDDEEIAEEVLDLIKRLEPRRKRKNMPGKKNAVKVVGIFREHCEGLLRVQRKMYENADPKSMKAMVKAVEGTRDLDILMAKLGGSVFSEKFMKAHLEKVAAADAKLKIVGKC